MIMLCEIRRILRKTADFPQKASIKARHGRTVAERRQMPCELLHISSNLADAPRLFIGRNESVN